MGLGQSVLGWRRGPVGIVARADLRPRPQRRLL